jgi:hypothetical protein
MREPSKREPSIGACMQKRVLAARSIIWIILSIGMYLGIAAHVLDRGMPSPVSPRYTLYAIPAAVSILRGSPHDYTAQMTVATFFVGDPAGDTDAQIRAAIAAPKLEDAGLWFVSGDDKGLIDLTYAAFQLFGAKIGSIVTLVVALIGLSCVLFALQFWRSEPAMALLVSILCGLSVVSFTFGVSDQAASIAEPRFLGMISLVSSFHLMLAVRQLAQPTIKAVVICALQTALIILVVHIRSAEFWQILAVGACGFYSLAINRAAWRIVALLSVLLLAGVAGLAITAATQYHTHYSQTDVTTRVLWHNALVGLAINPSLQASYGIRPLDDVSVMEAVRKHMIAEGRGREAEDLYRVENYSAGNFKDFQWREYEVQARRLFFDIVREEPSEVVRTYLLFAPRVAWGAIEDLRGVQRSDEDYLLRNSPPTKTHRAEDQYFSLVRPLPLAAIGIASLLMLFSRPAWRYYELVLPLALLFCLAPIVLATPAIWYLQLPLTIASAWIYLTVIALTSRLGRMMIIQSGRF